MVVSSAAQISRIWEMKKAKPEGKRPLLIPRRRWDDSIKIISIIIIISK
jgi:hypothetical protein